MFFSTSGFSSFLFYSRESRWVFLSLPPLFWPRGGGERGTGAATNVARQARPALRVVRRTKKGGRAGSGVAWRGAVVTASSAPPVVACDSRALTSVAPGFNPRACTKVHTRVAKSPWQPRDDKCSPERGRGAPAAG